MVLGDVPLLSRYREAVARIMGVIEEMKPAGAMIDTEELPGPLNFAVTRRYVNWWLSRRDAIVEAEYGATSKPEMKRSTRLLTIRIFRIS